MKIKPVLLLFLLFSSISSSSTVLAADMMMDINGTWAGVVVLENGQELDFVATFNQEGSRVNGVLVGIGGPDIRISNGRIENNILYFSSIRPINEVAVPFDYIAVNSSDYLNITIIRVGAIGPNSVLSTMTRRQE